MLHRKSGKEERSARVRMFTACVLVLGVSAIAHADDDAKSLFERGTALFALHRFADAAALYEKAFELKPDPAILYNAAQAHRLAGNGSRALELYQGLLRLYPGKIANRAEVLEHVRQLELALETAQRARNAPPVTPLPAAKPARNRPFATTSASASAAPSSESHSASAKTSSATALPPSPAVAKIALHQPASPVIARASPPLRHESITKRRWFWGVVASGAAVVIAGATVGIVIGTSKTIVPTPSFGVAQGN
jgi:tetratricopeptide (TPR) repeat protein